jgi:hypothetical protein
MHLDRTNNASKNYYENANTLTHDDDHLVVLAHLRWRWRWHFQGIEMTIFYCADVEN